MTRPERLPISRTIANPTACSQNAATSQLRSTVLLFRPIIEPRDVCRQEMQSRYRRSASRAMMRAVADLRAEIVDVMNGRNHDASCHRYTRPRPSRTDSATDPLSARMSQALGPLDSRTTSRSCQTGATYMAGTISVDFVALVERTTIYPV